MLDNRTIEIVKSTLPLPECEMIKMDEINEAFDRMEKSDVRYRFVIDMASLSA